MTWQYLIHHFVLWDLQCTLVISQASDIKESGNETNWEMYPLHILDLGDSDARGRFVGKWQSSAATHRCSYTGLATMLLVSWT
jgi:hypothetical protein